MKLPNGGGAYLGSKPQTMRNSSQHAQTIDVMSETRTSELPSIGKANTATTSPNNKLQKSVKLSAVQNGASLNQKLNNSKEEQVLKH